MLNPLILKIKERLDDPTSREIATGSLLFFITKIVGILMTYFFAWWVSNIYGATKWGVYAFCFTLINIFTIGCSLGLDSILVKYVSEYNSKMELEKLKDTYLKVLLVVSPLLILVSLFLIIFPDLFCRLFLDGQNFDAWIRVVGFTLPAYVLFQLNNSGISGLKMMLPYGIFKNIVLYGFTIIVFYLLNISFFPQYFTRFTESGILLLLTFGIITWLAVICNTFFFLKQSKIYKVKRKIGLTIKKILSESFPMFLTASMIILITTTDILMLGIMKSNQAVGIYDICVKISIGTGVILLAVNSIATPKFSEYFSNGKMDLLKQTVSQSTKLIFWTSLPIILIISFFATDLLGLFGEEFIIGSLALIILAGGQFINAFCGAVGNLLKMTNNHIVFQNIVIIAAILNIVLNLILIPNYSYVGAAIASTISIAFWNLVAVFYAKKRLGILSIYLPFITR